MGLQRRAHLRSLMNEKSGLSEQAVLFSCPNGRDDTCETFVADFFKLPYRGAKVDSSTTPNLSTHPAHNKNPIQSRIGFFVL